MHRARPLPSNARNVAPVEPRLERRRWVVGTRGSPLALAQAEEFARRVRATLRGSVVEVRVIQTSGDAMPEAALAAGGAGGAGAKGWFTRELEEALHGGTIDFAVHSLKDLPTTLPEGLELAGVLERADVRDVLVYRDEAWVQARGGPEEWSPGQRLMRGFRPGLELNELPKDARVGTSSPRRAAWVRRAVPTADVTPLRGNVGTRLARLAATDAMDAAVLALAGLQRLGLFVGPGGHVARDPRRPTAAGTPPTMVPDGLMGTVLDPESMLPAPGQGALGIEVASGNADAAAVAARLNHRNTWVAVQAEREFLRGLGGGCAAPVSALGRVLGHQLELRVAVERHGRWWTATGRRVASEGTLLGAELAAEARRESGGWA